MDNRILHIFAPLERLDILSLWERVFFDGVWKQKEEYGIKIIVDTGVLETSEYCITGDNRIVRKDNLWEIAHIHEDFSIMPFTLESYYEIVAERIQYILPAIGLTMNRYDIDDGSLTISFTINTQSQEEYKQILHDRIWWQFEYKTYEGLDTIKKRVLEFIGKQSQLLDIDSLVIGKENIDIAFDDLPKPKPITIPQDDIVLCDIYLSEDPLELVLHDMILDWFIETMEEYRGRFKVKINRDACLKWIPTMRPIRFDKITGIVYLHDKPVWNLPIKKKGYMLFSILYDSPNIPLPADLLMEKGKFESASKTDEVFIDQAIDEAIDTRLWKAFSDKYIKREANHFRLINQEE